MWVQKTRAVESQRSYLNFSKSVIPTPKI